ncbi:MAG: hypothetical protein KDA75_15450 [Planctomycetaceae bacterium]|nr:hypothetical protein [Planctomycetaceae bacterium]
MKLALIGPDMTGHLNPMSTLGGALQRAGHEVSLCGIAPSKRWADRAGLGFIEFGREEHASGLIETGREKLGRLQGLKAMRWTTYLLQQAADIVLRDAPPALQAAGIEGVIADQVTPGGSSVAEVLGLPCAIVCNALAFHLEPSLPPAVLPWPYRTGLLARMRNRFGNAVLVQATTKILKTVNRFRTHHGLIPIPKGVLVHEELIQVAQQPEFLDFPRLTLPSHFHYTGPWHHSDRDSDVPFPWDRLDGRPLVYASLGTLQNRLDQLFRNIIDACSTLDVQLVLSLGRPEGQLAGPVPSGTIVVPYAPQLALLDRASAVITHGGLNTSLETLARGLPMVALPMTNDQPGVARRLEWLGVARVVLPTQATVSRLRTALRDVLEDQNLRKAAEHRSEDLRQSPDVDTAAALITHAFKTRQRVHRSDAGLPVQSGGA